jgi:hypothetical protein
MLPPGVSTWGWPRHGLPLGLSSLLPGFPVKLSDLPTWLYAIGVIVRISDDAVEVILSPWQKVLGLMGSIRVPRVDIGDVEVIERPARAVMGAGMMAGLRVPALYYIARTIRLDQAWIVRRGVPALSFSVRNHGALKRVVVSTPEAAVLAERLGGES